MSERAQKTRLHFGDVSAEVGLIKTGTKPRAAQHETKRFEAEPPPAPAQPGLQAAATAGGFPTDPAEAVASTHPVAVPQATDAPVDPLAGDGAPLAPPVSTPIDAPVPDWLTNDAPMPRAPEDYAQPTAEAVDAAERGDGPPVVVDSGASLESELKSGHVPPDVAERQAAHYREALGLPDTRAELDAQHDAEADALDSSHVAETEKLEVESGERVLTSAPVLREYKAPATTVQQGVHTEAGKWLDLTDELEAIDARTRVDGLEVVATIDATAIPRERVRDAHYIGGSIPAEYKVLALLWGALRTTRRAAAVRWTKKTAQALGIIVARGELGNPKNPAHLVLLELEWAENIRKPAPRVVGPIKAETNADEQAAAIELVSAFAAGPSAVNDLRDQRLAKRAELLDLARAGNLAKYVAPPAPRDEPDGLPDGDESVAALLAGSAAWAREYVDAILPTA